MIINHNIAALNTYRQLAANTSNGAKSLEKLSSGLRINKASDDAAGLAISEKMRGQIRGLNQAARNSQDAISLIQTAEGALAETHSILQRMRELATQSANDSNVTQDRAEMQKELNQLSSEINRIGNSTEFNTQKLLNGGAGQTGSIRYSVVAAGVTALTATGTIGSVSPVVTSVKAGTAAITLSNPVSSKASAVPITGATGPMNELTAGVVGGTGSAQLFRTETVGVKAANAGAVGSPFIVQTASVASGTGTTEVSELVAGRSTAVTNSATTGVAGIKAVDNYEVTLAFVAADTVTIDGVAFTAKAGVANAANKEFSIDTGINAQVTSLKAAIEADATLSGRYAVSSATDTLTLTDLTFNGGIKQAGTATIGGTGTGTITATPAQTVGIDAVASVDNYKFTQFGEGSTVTLAGQIFTAKPSGAIATNGEFNIGSDVNATVNSLRKAINANSAITSNYIVSGATDTVTLTETNAADGAKTQAGAASISNANNYATYAIELKTNFTAGDTLKVGDITYTATTAASSGNNFHIGDTLTETRDSIKVMIEATNDANDTAYVISTTDPKWAGSNDNNLLVFKAAASGLDANAADMSASAASKSAAVNGVYKFELQSNFEVGQSIKLGDKTYTATDATTGLQDSSHFKVGADTTATATNLMDAITAGPITNYTAARGTGIYADTITLTETVAEGPTKALAVTDLVSDVTGVAGKYSFELKSNFSTGDKISIGGVAFTATDASNGTNDGTHFRVGVDSAATAASLKTAIMASTLNTKYTATNVALSKKITLTENDTQFGAGALADPSGSVVKATETLGQYDFTVTDQFTSGEKMTIGGQVFTAKANGAVTANGEFNVGANAILTADSLRAAITGKLAYTVNANGSATIVMTQKSATTTAPTISAVTNGFTSTKGAATITLGANPTAGDKITIAGEEFTAIKSTDAPADGKFVVGATLAETYKALATQMTTKLTAYTSTVIANTSDPLSPTYTINMEEKSAAGIADVTVSATKVAEVAGKYTANVTHNFAVGDKLTLAGVTLTAGTANTKTTFAVDSDINVTTTNIKNAINANDTLKDLYTATSLNSTLALAENTGKAIGSAPAFTTLRDGTAGVFEFSTSALAKGSKITVDTKELTLLAGGSESQTATELKSLIEADTTLKDKYSVAVDNASVTLTQKVADSAAPTLAYQTQAGDGFRGSMQIGANAGQSLAIDINDMRATALKATSATGGTADSVEANGLRFQVAWTANATVTNGTDNVASEYALDISNHDNATAAVQVIDAAMTLVSGERSKIGAFQNRLEHTINNLGTTAENMTAAESRIRDVDMAKEMMEFTKNNILSQAAQAMLAQANQQPQGVLQLLR